MEGTSLALHPNPALRNTPENIAALIDGYRPRIPERHWMPIADFVRAVVHDAHPESRARARRMVTEVARFTHWATAELGCPLDRDLFDPPLMRQFYSTLRGTLNAQTIKVAAAHLADVEARLDGGAILRNIPSNNTMAISSVPYAPGEFAAIRAWVASRRTVPRVNATFAVGLAAGAGLTAADMIPLTTEHIHDHGPDGGLEITVPGQKRSRTTWCTIPWEPEIRWALSQVREGEYLFSVDSTVRKGHQISAFLNYQCGPHDLPVLIHRLRASWFVSHLDTRTPLNVLLPAANMQTTTQNITRYVPHMTTPDPHTIASLLRQEGIEN